MKLSILFVDDEQSILEGHRRHSRSLRDKWDTRFALSGQAAINLLSDKPANVVVSDLQMPGMTGLELVAEIKKLYPSTQCIVLTGTADLQTTIDTINQGQVFRFYVKPSSFTDLAAGINKAAEFSNETKERNESTALGRAALDTIPYAVFVVSADAHLLFTNSSAQKLLESKECMNVGHDRVLRTMRPSETYSLHNAIANVVARIPSSEGQALSFNHPLRDHSYYCTIKPFIQNDRNASKNAVIYVTYSEKVPFLSPDILAGLFNLTSSESKLLAYLVSSGKLGQASIEAGLSENTARTYVKQIFSKTGTGSQGELIQKVLLSPAIFGRGF